MKEMKIDIAVIGGGPAGMAAALPVWRQHWRPGVRGPERS